VLYWNTDKNEAYVEQFLSWLASHVYLYLYNVAHYSARCCQKLVTTWFKVEEGLQAQDAQWDQEIYAATMLRSITNQSYNRDMEQLGMVDIAPELLAEMMKGTNKRPYFDTKAMQQVAEHMQLKPTNGANFSVIDSSAFTLSENMHTTNRQDFIRSVTTKTVEVNLSRARQEFCCLCTTLWEMSPGHVIFKESTFVDNVMETGLLGSNKSEELEKLYREMRASSFCLRACINEVKQLALIDRRQIGTPPPSESAAPPPPSPRATVPDGIQEWGSAGIVEPCKSIVRDAGNRCDIGIPNPLPQNSAMGRGHASTEGGFPGACVGEHN
jgi:hypothetical protein